MNRRIRKKKDKKITEAINGLISIAEWQERQRQFLRTFSIVDAKKLP